MSSCVSPLLTASKRLSRLPSPNSLSSRRYYAVTAGGAPRFQVFNRRTKWLQKERSALKPDESRQADYLKDEVAIRLTERLLVSESTYFISHSRLTPSRILSAITARFLT